MKYTFTIEPSDGVLNTVAYTICNENNNLSLKKLNSITSYDAMEFGVSTDEPIVNIVILEFTTTNANLKTGVLNQDGFSLDEEVVIVPIFYPDNNNNTEIKTYKYTKNPNRNFCIINALSGEQLDIQEDKCEIKLSVPYVVLEVAL